ncbi:MAG: GyrI-like domain-containing protein, partial [Phycisphaerae bacterium]
AGVRVRHLDPATIVYLEHRGPYWGMGKLFGQVAALMAEQDQAGPMFARYLDDPAETELENLRGQVGFFAETGFMVSEPFRRAALGPRWVASFRVEGQFGRSPAAQTKVRNWVRAQGWTADRAVMEVYPTGQERVTEVRVVILKGGPVGQAADPQVADDGALTPAWRLAQYRRMLQALPMPAQPQVRPVQACVDQLCLRIQAIAQAAGRSYPDRAAVFAALSTSRLEALGWGECDDQAEAGAAIRPLGAQGLEGPRFVDMIGQLDRLLVDVTLGRVEAAAALKEFAELTAWVPEAKSADTGPPDD